jgi:anti-sigma B factor antagonist
VLRTGSSIFRDGVWVVDLEGELDLASSWRLDATVGDVLDRHPADVLLDFERVTFLDSSAVAAILKWQRRLRGHGARIGIVRPRGMPRQFLNRTQLDRWLPVFDSVEEAVR